jgi:hypothetical protein
VPQFRDTYETLRKCCESAYAGQSSGACLSEEETETSSTDTTSTSSTTTIIQFYSNPSNGMCAIVDENVPSWIPASDYYTDWKECCLAGWVFDNCMAANPLSTEEETLVEDEQETTSSTTTVLQFYSNPSNGLCAIVDESTPSWIITRYTNWAECCKAGWVFDKCMSENPLPAGEETVVEDEEESTTTTTSSTSSSTTTSDDACKLRAWHPITIETQICTNSESYPQAWNDPALKEKYLFATAKECCKKLYKNSSCEVVDTCS